ncbi:hypothetical protein Rleg_5462 (plasmid) [Rhizobium leguminosarum bv. trifolii WSM1325]|uniref:Endonuclease n=1 Tax=Rhizobium leguminosarum bv. trifolii (strain WSM1325) TaxID=395491 RepID=C6B8P5_RHILS|nr:hypothetical protein [Rhizobium leguminosarum]ACS60283.1 hypothetical protein Rleg_5462 [Rhizobium leguminosarum bv. trifolii WSM1325]
MIFIERSDAADSLPVYTKPTVKSDNGAAMISRSADELEKAIAFYTDKTRFKNDAKLTNETFNFTVYKDKGLADVLALDFFHKCVYCESSIGHVMPDDVEHFRPKSEVECDAGSLRPGYYWLAGDWRNLLISCRDCNAPRAHREPGQAKGVAVGKGTQFPLSDPSKRVRNHSGNVKLEEAYRLLIHPCIDDPEEHIIFDESGLAKPAALEGEPSIKGKTSIDVYALQRKVLVERRLAEITKLRGHLLDLISLVRKHERYVAMPINTSFDRLENAKDIRRSLKTIIDMLRPEEEYVGAKRSIIRAAYARGDFDILTAHGIRLDQFLKIKRRRKEPPR